MASVIYNSYIDDSLRALIDNDTSSFKCMLVTSAYTPNVDTHLDRADVTNEVTGTGYTAGGTAATLTVTKDTGNDRVTVQLGAVSWATSTITARGAIYYLDTGVAGNDRLIAYIDFGSDISSTAATFSLTASTITFQNNSAA